MYSTEIGKSKETKKLGITTARPADGENNANPTNADGKGMYVKHMIHCECSPKCERLLLKFQEGNEQEKQLAWIKVSKWEINSS